MTTVTTSQMQDAMHYAAALNQAIKTLPAGEEFGGGLRMFLPDVIPLTPDYNGEEPRIWLVANDFEGYDITTVEPKTEDQA